MNYCVSSFAHGTGYNENKTNRAKIVDFFLLFQQQTEADKAEQFYYQRISLGPMHNTKSIVCS